MRRRREVLAIDETQRNKRIKKIKNWRREINKALTPLNGELTKMIKETFRSCPELTELRFVFCGSNYIAKRDDYMND